MSVVAIEVDGQDMTNRVLFSSARFNSQVNATAGDFYIRLRDPDRTLAFPTGCAVVCRIDGDVAWRGFMFQWERTYVFPAMDVDADGETRFFDMRGSDLNILFNKRFVFNQSTPTEVQGKLYPPHTDDDVMIADLVADYLDLSGDGIDTSTFVDNVGESTVDQEGRAWQAGDSWGQAMSSIANLPAAIFYLQPTNSGGQLVYCDVDTPNAPFSMSDVPGAGTSGSQVLTYTDDFERTVALSWGTGGIGTWQMYYTDGGFASVSGGFGHLVNGPIGDSDQSVLLPTETAPATEMHVRGEFVWPAVVRGNDSLFEIDIFGPDLFDPDLAMFVAGDGFITAFWSQSPDGNAEDAVIDTPVGGSSWGFDLLWQGPVLRVKAWPLSGSEPSYQASLVDVPFTMADIVSPTLLVFDFGAEDDEFLVDNLVLEATVPTPGNSVGYREMEILQDGTALVNDQFAWGIGYGSNTPVFVRDQDPASQALHGLWQAGVVAFGVYKQGTINRIAASVVDGSPQNKRGHKDDAVSVQVSTYQPGFLPAQKIDFTSEVWDFNDVIPIRKMEITFEAPDSPKFALVLSHEIDTPFGLIDPFFLDYSLPQITIDPPPPWPPFPGPGGCFPICQQPVYRSGTDDYIVTNPYLSGELNVTLDGAAITVTETDPSAGVFSFETGNQSAGMVACYSVNRTFDDFQRTVVGGLGTSTDGHVWNDVGDGELSVNGSQAVLRSYVVVSGFLLAAARVTAAGPWNLDSYVMTTAFTIENAPSSHVTLIHIGQVEMQASSVAGDTHSYLKAAGGANVAVDPSFWVAGGHYTVRYEVVANRATARLSDGVDVYTAVDPTGGGESSVFNLSSHAFILGGEQRLLVDFIDFDYAGKPCHIDCTSFQEPYVIDDFNRTVGSGWGTASSGGAWTKINTGGTASTESVNGSMGLSDTPLGSLSTGRMVLPIDATFFASRDFIEFRVLVTTDVEIGEVTIGDGGGNYIWWDVNEDGDIGWGRGQGGSVIPLQSSPGNPLYASNNPFWVALKLQSDGRLYSKNWLAAESEPGEWDAPNEPTFTSDLNIAAISEVTVLVGNSGILTVTGTMGFDLMIVRGSTCVPVGGQGNVNASSTGYGCEIATRVDATTYQCSSSMVAGTSRVFIDGLFQRPGDTREYTESTAASGTIAFNDPVPAGSVVRVCYYTAGPIGGGA